MQSITIHLPKMILPSSKAAVSWQTVANQRENCVSTKTLYKLTEISMCMKVILGIFLATKILTSLYDSSTSFSYSVDVAELLTISTYMGIE